MKHIDINCDLGEGYGRYTAARDADIMPHISSCNIACGYHAGDALVMHETVRLALQHGVAIGAHPAYPDLQGFGRRSMALTEDELTAMLWHQLGGLQAMVHTQGGRLQHIKLHGALYNDAMRDEGLAATVAQAVKRFDASLCVVGLPASALQRACTKAGLKYVREAFADRNYAADGALLPRSDARAVLRDADRIIQRLLHWIESAGIEDVNGQPLTQGFDTVCVHGDHPGSEALVARLAGALKSAGVALRSVATEDLR